MMRPSASLRCSIVQHVLPLLLHFIFSLFQIQRLLTLATPFWHHCHKMSLLEPIAALEGAQVGCVTCCSHTFNGQEKKDAKKWSRQKWLPAQNVKKQTKFKLTKLGKALNQVGQRVRNPVLLCLSSKLLIPCCAPRV